MKKLLLTILMIMGATLANGQNLSSMTNSDLCDIATYTLLGNTQWKHENYDQYIIEAKKRGITCGVTSDNKDFIIESFYKSSNSYYKAELTIYNTTIKRIKCRALRGKTVVGSEELYITDKWETMIIRVNNGNANSISCNSYTSY